MSINSNKLDYLSQYLKSKFQQIKCKISNSELTIEVEESDFLKFCLFLKIDNFCKFEQLIDVCGVDYSTYGSFNWNKVVSSFSRATVDDELPSYVSGARFAVVYHFLSLLNNQRVRLRVFLKNSSFPSISSIVDIWPSANWYEREAYDLFGIVFDNHPDLRRILTDYGFKEFPMRKDFPVVGKEEIRYDSVKRDIIYEKTNVKIRTLVPKVIRK